VSYPVEVDKQVFWLVSYLTQESSKEQQLLIRQKDGEAKVDWESKVVYQPNDLDEFVANRVDEPKLFRVYLESVDYAAFYGFEFSDYKKYQSYKIMLKGRDDYLWGYAEIGSELNQQLQEKFVKKSSELGNKKRKKSPATILIKFPKNSMSAKCVSIEELVSDSWMLFE